MSRFFSGNIFNPNVQIQIPESHYTYSSAHVHVLVAICFIYYLALKTVQNLSDSKLRNLKNRDIRLIRNIIWRACDLA